MTLNAFRSLAVVVLGLGCAVAQTVTVTLSPIRDATLYEDPTGQIANGSGQYVFVGQNASGLRRRALFAFDVSGIPFRSRIVFARLDLAITRASASQPTDVHVHRVLADWGEGASVASGGEGGGGPAQPGDATWLHRSFPSQPWATPGGDFAVASAMGSAPVLGTVQLGTTTSMIGDVQQWLDDPTQNFGWLVMTDENLAGTARRVDSRENNALTTRPSLTVGYLPPGNALSVGLGCVTSQGQRFSVTVQGQPIRGQRGAIAWSGGIPGGLVAPLLSYDITPAPLDVAPGCTFWLRLLPFPSLGFRVLDQAGSSIEPFDVPPGAALFGAPFAMQSVMIDFAQPLGFALSNAHLICIG